MPNDGSAERVQSKFKQGLGQFVPRPHLAVRNVTTSAWKLLVILLFVVLMAVPVIAVLSQAFSGAASGDTLWTHATFEAFRNTLLLGLLVSVVSATLAYLLAWSMFVTGLAHKPFARAGALIPFMGPPYLMSIGWILFMEPNGWLDRMAPGLSFLSNDFFSIWGLVCVMSLHLFPVPFVSALQSIQSIKSRHDAVAGVHGAPVWYRWLRIWIPLSLPLLAASSVLVFVKTIGEFGTPLVFGSLLHFPVLTTTIYLHMSSWPINFGTAAQLSALLLGTVLLVWMVNDIYQRKTYTVESARNTSTLITTTSPLWSRLFGGIFIGFVSIVSIGIPIGSLFVTSLLRIEGDGFRFANLSLVHYRNVLTGSGDAVNAVLTTLELALVSATIALVLSVALAVLARFYSSKSVKVTEWMGLLPNSIPDVLLVIGLILFWNAPWLPVTPYNTKAMLEIGYVIVLFPFAYNYARAALFQIAPGIWESALVHQASRWNVALRIVAPLMTYGMVSGWIMVFGVTLRDLVVPMLLSPPNTTLISTYIYGQYDQGSLPDAMALAVVTLVLTIVVFTVVQWFNSRLNEGSIERVK